LQIGKSLNDLGMPGYKRHAPADHIEPLGERVHLDTHFLGAVHLQEAQRGTVKAEENMSRILNDRDPVGAPEVDDLTIKVARGHSAGGTVRVIEDEQLGPTADVGGDSA